MNRWHSLLRYDLSRPQSSPYGRPESPAIRSVPLGWCDFRNVQLLDERLQDEEWRLPFLAAAVLSLLAVFHGMEESFLSPEVTYLARRLPSRWYSVVLEVGWKL